MSLSKRKWASLALLSIMVPIGLLATFRLAGVLQEPPTPETINVDIVYWNMSRPEDTINQIGERVDSSYTDGVASVGVGVSVDRYDENHPNYGRNDLLWLTANVEANVVRGSISLVIVRFSQTDADAILDIVEDPFPSEINLKIVKITGSGTYTREAHVEAHSHDNSTNCYMEVMARWIFHDQNNISHQLTITAELTYFNGTAWERIKIPIQLEVLTE